MFGVLLHLNKFGSVEFVYVLHFEYFQFFVEWVTDNTATPNGHQMAVVTWDRSIQCIPALVRPVIIMGSKEEDGELPRLMWHRTDVVWEMAWVADLARPPTVVAQFDPDYVPVMEWIPAHTLLTVPGALREWDAQTLRMECRRTTLATK